MRWQDIIDRRRKERRAQAEAEALEQRKQELNRQRQERRDQMRRQIAEMQIQKQYEERDARRRAEDTTLAKPEEQP